MTLAKLRLSEFVALREGMSKLLILVVALLVVAVAVAGLLRAGGVPSTYPAEVQLTGADDGAVVGLAQGGMLIVALSSNPSTGYAWSVAERSGSGLELVASTYVPPGSTVPVVGATGTEVFTFRGAAEGATILVLEYRRPFEAGAAPERTFEVTVHVAVR